MLQNTCCPRHLLRGSVHQGKIGVCLEVTLQERLIKGDTFLLLEISLLQNQGHGLANKMGNGAEVNLKFLPICRYDYPLIAILFLSNKTESNFKE